MVGGGISGMTAAIEAAECGKDVVLLETNPSAWMANSSRTRSTSTSLPRPWVPRRWKNTTRRLLAAAVRWPSPNRRRPAQIKKIIESAYDFGAEMIVTPCPVCQMNVEVYQSQINKKYGTKFNIPVLYYSQLMAVAYGATAKEAGLDGNIVRATKLEEIAAKK